MQWRIEGAHHQTGEDITTVIDADSESEATTKARTAGLLVSSIKPISSVMKVILPDPPATEHLIMLNCPNCGASLGIGGEIDIFGCGYCGTQLMVRRQDGTVSLKRVTEAIQKVQVGTDKTAAELAIARYEKELVLLRAETKRLRNAQAQAAITMFVTISSLVMLACGLIANGAVAAGLLVMTFGVLLGVKAHGKDGTEELKQIRARIQELESVIAEKRRIADA